MKENMFKYYIISLLTSGRYTELLDEKNFDSALRLIVLNITYSIMSIIIIGLGVSNMRIDFVEQGLLELIIGFLLLVNLLLLRTELSYKVGAYILIVLYGIFCAMSIYFWNDKHDYSIMWIYSFPLISILTLGLRGGLIPALALLIIAIIATFVPGITEVRYTSREALFICGVYTVVMILTIIFDYVRSMKDSWLDRKEKQISEQHEKALRQSHWYEAILDATPLPISVTDVDMKWTFVNKAVETFLGRNRSDMYGKHCREWNSHVCNTDNCGISCVRRGIKRTYFKHGDSSFQADVEILRDKDGEDMGYVEIVQDVTVVEATARQKADAANQAKTAFLSTMSHEIRTPINAVLGIADIQLLNEKLEPDIKDAFDRIHSSGEMLLGIINDILDLSRIESGKLELLIDKYETASMICDTAQLNIMRIDDKPIEFILSVDENVPFNLLGDELRVKQVLNNLLSNAFKYTEAGTVKMTFSVLESSDDSVILEIIISDTGQGMSQDQVERIFEEYSRFNLEANRTTEGIGLGMGIARSLIELMNGEIFVISEHGKGSTFTIHLPQGRVDDNVLGSEIVRNLQNFRTVIQKQYSKVKIVREPMPYGSVLIVDDVETNIYVANGLLSPYRLKIDSVDSGFEAIKKIKNGYEYDIIFMDHMMPVMDGIETTKKIREMGYKNTIVALTANAVVGQSDVFLQNGFDDFISKPIDVGSMNDILNKYIRDKQPPEVLEDARRQFESEGDLVIADEKSPSISHGIAEVFIRDAGKSIDVIKSIVNKGDGLSLEEIDDYIIHTHGLKSALANVGSHDLSMLARKLEEYGNTGNQEAIMTHTPAFLTSLCELIESLTVEDDLDNDREDENPEYLHKMLIEIKAACEEYDEKTADAIIAGLRDKAWSKTTTELLEKLAIHLLHSDFDNVVDDINSFL